MRLDRSWLTATAFTLVMLIGAMGVVIQRQFAQGKKVAASPPVAVKERIGFLTPSVGSSDPALQAKFLDERDAGLPRSFISAETEFERKLVKGAPFSAELVMETVQPLQDGTSTVRRSASVIYRDNQGRTRRDRLAEQNDPRSALGGRPQVSIINDLVAGFTYVLEHSAALASRTTLLSLGEQGSEEPSSSVGAAASPPRARASAYLILPPRGEAGGEILQAGSAKLLSVETKKESLGRSEIGGMIAEGTRLTKTIPAGAFGNRQPIKIVAERWYSPELQTVVLIERSDPRFGKSIYRLTGIQRAEPAATLFRVPSDYKIKDE